MMLTSRWGFAALVAVAGIACGGVDPSGLGVVGPGDDGGAPASDSGATAADGGSATTNDAGRASDGGASDGGKTTDGGGVVTDGSAPCYSEIYHPSANVADLAMAYSSSAWLASSLETMHRRYPTGHFILDAEMGDSQLAGFADSSSWPALMESLMTMVHEETHGYDFEHSQAGNHLYVQRDDQSITVPELANMWPRSEIAPLLTDDATSAYDQTYLNGTQGTYDVIFLMDEMTAYTNGLAAITAVADQISSPISARDGAVAHLLYLELYLKAGRTAHPTAYAAMKADANWQKMVRFAWARVFFWDARAMPFPALDIGTSKIWPHVKDAANLDEIKQFTGEDAMVVACHP